MATPAAATTASATISSTPSVVKFTPTEAKVKVTYTCVNDATTIYYLVATLHQDDAGYSYGFRNGPGGLHTAKCTGKKVTQNLVLISTFGEPVPAEPGEATLYVKLSSRFPNGGQYYGDGTPGGGPIREVTEIVTLKVG